MADTREYSSWERTAAKETTVFSNPNITILIEFDTYLKCMAPAAHGPGFYTNSSQSLTDITRGAWGKHTWFSDPAQFSCHIIRQNTLKKSKQQNKAMTATWKLCNILKNYTDLIPCFCLIGYQTCTTSLMTQTNM